MKLDTKTSSFFGGLLGLVGATGLVLTTGGGFEAFTVGPGSGAPTDEPEFCLISDAPFFSDFKAGCYPRSILKELYKRDLVNDRGATVTVEMTSPPEAPQASDKCRTCEDFSRFKRLGWFALSNRDQRREEFFHRACGMLDYLLDSKSEDQSYFTDGLLSSADVVAIPSPSLLHFTTWPNHHEGDGQIDSADRPERSAPVTMETGLGWVVGFGDQAISIQPLSHADFNGDGLGDMLVYMRTHIQSGTAFGGTTGYLVKTSDDGPVLLKTR